MRTWLTVLIALVLVGSLYVAMTWFGGPEVDLPDLRVPESNAEERPADPLRTDRTPTGDPNPDPGPPPVRQAITASAQNGATRQPLPGFKVVLARGGRDLPPIEVETDRHTFRLEPGDYILRAEKPGWTAPAPTTFRVHADATEPVTIQLPFSRAALQLTIEVRDASSKRPIDSYRATVRRWAPGADRPHTEFLPAQTVQPLQLIGEPEHRVAVQIEAEGYRPPEAVEVTFASATPVVHKQVFLARQMKFTGIELRVFDAVRQPIRRLNVLAHRLAAAAEPKFVWNRTAAAGDGNYRLPDLAPGKYRFVLTAVDDQDNPTLHVPHTREVEYFDGQHIITPITLTAGAMIELHATDPDGRTIGTDVWVELVHPDGKSRESIWQPLTDGKPNHHAGLGADKLIQDAPARLHRCLPPGGYTLKVRWGRGEPVERPLDLIAGRKTDIRVRLSR